MFGESGDHINRLTMCSKCGREVSGEQVRAQADLIRPGQLAICEDCVGTGTDTSPTAASAPVPRGADDARIEALERLLATVLARLDDLTGGQRPESVKDQVSALEARVSKSFAAVVEFAESNLTALGTELAESRSELAAAKDEIDRRLVEITSWLSAQPGPEALMQTFRGEMKEVETRLARSPDAPWAEMDALSGGLAQARLEIASLGEQLRASEEALRQLIETRREEVRNAVAERVRQEVATLVRAAEELLQARELVESKLDGLVETALDTDMRVNALASSADAAAGGLHALEESTREWVHRLTALIDNERRAREEAQARNDQAAREQRAAAPPPPPTLLDALDRQLQEAEVRLAKRVSAKNRR